MQADKAAVYSLSCCHAQLEGMSVCSGMVRIYKHYDFAVQHPAHRLHRMSFSGYPGMHARHLHPPNACPPCSPYASISCEMLSLLLLHALMSVQQHVTMVR